MKLDKFEILKTFISMHKGTLINEVKVGEGIILTYCKDPDIWWNFALVNHVLSNNELEYIEKFFKTKNRKSTIYFTDDISMEPLISLLEDKGYEQNSKDSWLFWNRDTQILIAKEL